MNRVQRDIYCGGPPTIYQRVAAILAPALLLGLLVYLAAIYCTLPEEFPTHYTFSGEVDGYGSRAVVWLTPILGVFMDLTMWIVGLFPQSWNSGARITPFNRTRMFRLMRDLMADLRLAMAVMWIVLSLFTVHGWWRRGGLFILGIFILIFAPLVRYFLRVYIIKR